MKQKHELKELLDRFKEWKGKRLIKEDSDVVLDEVENVLESFLFDPAGDDSGSSNPPGHGPGTPP